MTSHERDQIPVYAGVEKPRYSVLSYTWGRFEVRNVQPGRSLPIQNVPWAVPVIEESHFTVDAFRTVLDQIRVGTDWAWVDVACIDQKDIKVKMDEIGRQAAIFRNADFAYVWLSRLSIQPCFEAIAVIDEVEVTTQVGLKENDIRLRLLEDAFSLLLSDPWFTSLWTLQELMMRNDAMVLSSEGSLVTYCEDPLHKDDVGKFIFPRAEVSKRPISFNKLCSLWIIQYDMLLKAAHEMNPATEESLFTASRQTSREDLSARMKVLGEVLEASGILQLNSNNPHIQYGAARYRKTRHAEDRIYAIMQIYGLRVGQTLRADYQPCLDDLRTEFGLAINTFSAVQGQMFVHTCTPYPGRSWCITEDSQVPQGLRECDDVNDTGTVVEEADGSVLITGQACPLSRLLKLHDGSLHPWTHSMTLQLRLYVDNDVARALEPETDPADHWEWQPPLRVDSDKLFTWEEFGFTDERYELGQKVSDRYGPDNLLVLRLGDIESFNDIYNGGFKEGGGDRLKQQVGQYLFRFPRKHIAVLLHKLCEDIEGISKASYTRLGVCSWVTAPLVNDYQADGPEAFDWEDLKRLIVDAYDDDVLLYSEAMRARFQENITIRVV
ncbi:hypothetical protein N0V82_003256 [Gnomoniopsis sp. IMI 355080]|nr:hypothetical protein N0V82_003256 [Gnomoniopsis sp. IMI 355080]